MYKWVSLFGLITATGSFALAHPVEGEPDTQAKTNPAAEHASDNIRTKTIDMTLREPEDEMELAGRLTDAETKKPGKWTSLENLAETVASYLGDKFEDFEAQDNALVERHLGGIDLDDKEFLNLKGGPIIQDGESLRDAARALDRVIADRRIVERYSDLVIGFLEKIEVTQNGDSSYGLEMFDKNVGQAKLIKNKIGIPYRLEVDGLNQSMAVSHERIKDEDRSGMRIILDIYDTPKDTYDTSEASNDAHNLIVDMPEAGDMSSSTEDKGFYDQYVGTWTGRQRQHGYGVSESKVSITLDSAGKPIGLITTEVVDISECDDALFYCEASGCTSSWAYMSETDASLTFNETVLEGDCVDGQVIVRSRANGGLRYKFIDGGNAENRSSGNLKREKSR